MQDPSADTEWNDALRRHGILPEKKEVEVKEDDIIKMMDDVIKEKVSKKKHGDEESEEEDENWEDDDLLEDIRRQRLAELKVQQSKRTFGDVRQISAIDYVAEVNQAGQGVWVVLHLFKSGMPLCDLVNSHLTQLAKKFPHTKFLNSVSTTCIPNYPDKNLPTIFIYYEGEMKKQHCGPFEFGGMNLTKDDLEWMLSRSGCIDSKLKSNPRDVCVADSGGFNILTRNSRTRKDSESDDDDY